MTKDEISELQSCADDTLVLIAAGNLDDAARVATRLAVLAIKAVRTLEAMQDEKDANASRNRYQPP